MVVPVRTASHGVVEALLPLVPTLCEERYIAAVFGFYSPCDLMNLGPMLGSLGVVAANYRPCLFIYFLYLGIVQNFSFKKILLPLQKMFKKLPCNVCVYICTQTQTILTVKLTFMLVTRRIVFKLMMGLPPAIFL